MLKVPSTTNSHRIMRRATLLWASQRQPHCTEVLTEHFVLPCILLQTIPFCRTTFASRATVFDRDYFVLLGNLCTVTCHKSASHVSSSRRVVATMRLLRASAIDFKSGVRLSILTQPKVRPARLSLLSKRYASTIRLSFLSKSNRTTKRYRTTRLLTAAFGLPSCSNKVPFQRGRSNGSFR